MAKAELNLSINPDAAQIDALTKAVEDLGKAADAINASGTIDLTVNFNSTFDAPRDQANRQALIDAIQAVKFHDATGNIACLVVAHAKLFTVARVIAGDYIDQTPAEYAERKVDA